ncbi:hypothetical protein H4R19_006957 [Coemansia spiralis]|nr:hypothetical protein H4R19_006957 [Coemansia spiralis]
MLPSPLRELETRVQNAHLPEHEVQAVRRAVWRRRIWYAAGLAVGAGTGFLMTRRTKSLMNRSLMVLTSSFFIGSIGSQYGLVTSMRELTDPQKYPGITAAIKEMLQSHGVDPRMADRAAASKIRRRPDAGLPPPAPTSSAQQQQPAYETSSIGSRDAVYREPAQIEFGNPALEQELQQPQHEFGNPGLQPTAHDSGSTNPHSTWDYTRKSAPLQESAWDRLRRQSVLKEAGAADPQHESPWDNLTRYEGFRDDGPSATTDAFSASSDEPRRPSGSGSSSRESGGPSLAA